MRSGPLPINPKTKKLIDPLWRLNHLYSIVDKKSKKIRFINNVVQKRINKNDSLRKIILKARQFGVSTNEILKMFDRTIMHRNRNAFIMAHRKEDVEKLFRIVNTAYHNLDQVWQPKLDTGGGSKYELYFPEINSRIYCGIQVRGGTINDLLVSEAAFIKDDGRIKATLEAVPMDTGHVTLESTPNGIGNYFHDRWIKQTEFSYKQFFFPWYIFPDYRIPLNKRKIRLTDDEKKLIKKAKKLYQVDIDLEQIQFRRAKIEDLGQLFGQEYPEDDETCFLTSGHHAFDLLKLKEATLNRKEVIKKINGVKIFAEPDHKGIYVIGADTAEGVGGDLSAACVIDVKRMEQVASLAGQFSPHEFAHKLNEIGNYFTPRGNMHPQLAVERNNHGHAVLLELNEHIGYPNLYIADDEKTGWNTNNITRPIMMDTFINATESRNIKIHDQELINECMTLVVNNGKIEAASGKTDDRVIASAIAMQLCVKNSNQVYENIADMIIV